MIDTIMLYIQHLSWHESHMHSFIKSLKALIAVTLITAIASCHAFAQSFSASVEDVGGYYRLSFSVNAAGASNFTPPSLKDFEVLSGPSESTSSSFTYVNGHSAHSQSTTYTYILSARKSGRISIGAASVRVGSRVIHSRPISLNAAAGNQTNNSHGTASQMAAQGKIQVQQAGSPVTARDLFIDVTPSRTRVKEQEAILLTYRIHARVGVALSNTSLTQKPDFKGLISQEIPIPGNQIQTTIERRGGTTYRTGTILQYVIFPQKSGRITIPSITFDCAVVQQDNTMDLADAFFNGGGTIGVQVRRTVPVLNIQVDPLPEPRPANFSGAVGKFAIKAAVTTPSVKTNDVSNYRITLTGLGNLKLITAPIVNFPKDFTSYDAKTTDNTKINSQGLNGQLVFDYTFVPRNVGDYTIPATEFVFFDTETGAYKTIKTEPIKLHVAKGSNSGSDIDKKLALLNSDIRNLHNIDNATYWSWGSIPYIILVLIVIVLSIGAINASNVWINSHKDAIGMKKKSATKRSLKCLKKANDIMHNPSADNFYAAISQALTGYLADTFNLETSDITIDKLKDLLAEKGIEEQVVNNYAELLNTCQYAQFAPNANENKEDVYKKAAEVLTSIERGLKQ